MSAFEAAATDWLGRRRGTPDECPPGGPPGRNRAPAPRQTGAAGEAADAPADAALLHLRRLKSLRAGLPVGGGLGALPQRAAR
eukprot:3546150-Lingulodinium_polyedra.AAC.1